MSADKEGVVMDGSEEGIDIDYQLIANVLTVTFGGFESERDGIDELQVAVGSKPMYDDILVYTENNIISEDVDGIGMKIMIHDNLSEQLPTFIVCLSFSRPSIFIYINVCCF